MAALAQIDVMQEGVLFGLPMPFTFRPPVAMSDEELTAFSRRNRPYQIERNTEGELEIMSPVGGDGAHREAIVVGALGSWAKEYFGVAFSSNGGFTLPDGSMRSPDTASIAENRWNALSREDQRRHSPLCPAFLIEILTIDDSRARLQAKMRMWMANGAQLEWMIDPYDAEVLLYRPGAGTELLEGPDWVEAHTVVPGFRLETSRMWEGQIPSE